MWLQLHQSFTNQLLQLVKLHSIIGTLGKFFFRRLELLELMTDGAR